MSKRQEKPTMKENLSFAFVGGGGWNIYERLKTENIEIGKFVNLVDISSRQSKPSDDSNTGPTVLDLGLGDWVTGAGRNPFRMRVLFNHFQRYFFSKKIEREVMVYVGCPGGGFNSYGLYLLAGLPPLSKSNLCLAALSGPLSAKGWVTEAGNQILALPKLLTASIADKSFLSTILMETDKVEEARIAGGLPWREGDKYDFTARYCPPIFEALSYYYEPTPGYVKNFGDWDMERSALGAKIKTEPENYPLYIVPVPFSSSEGSCLSLPSGLALLAYQSGEKNSEAKGMGPLCNVIGKPRGVKLVVVGPSDYVRGCDERLIRDELKQGLNLDNDDTVEISLCYDEGISQVRGCLFLFSPPLRKFSELKDMADRRGIEWVSQWVGRLNEFRKLKDNINAAISRIRNLLGEQTELEKSFGVSVKTNVGDWSEFEAAITAETKTVESDWKTAKNFLEDLVRWSEGEGKQGSKSTLSLASPIVYNRSNDSGGNKKTDNTTSEMKVERPQNVKPAEPLRRDETDKEPRTPPGGHV